MKLRCDICNASVATVGLYIQPRANIRMFCAVCAAELLVPLKEMIRISDRKHDAWDRLKAIISKIETVAQ